MLADAEAATTAAALASASASASTSASAPAPAPAPADGLRAAGGRRGEAFEGAGGSAETLFLSLGGPAAFRSRKSFPVSHQELREELARLHQETRMAPGTLDSAMAVRPEAKREQQLLQQQQLRKQRKTDRRALQLTTADHLDDRTRAAVQRAAEENVRRLIEGQHAQQAQAAQAAQQAGLRKG